MHQRAGAGILWREQPEGTEENGGWVNHNGDETGKTGRRGSEVLVRRQQGASEGLTVSRSHGGRADFRIRCPS